MSAEATEALFSSGVGHSMHIDLPTGKCPGGAWGAHSGEGVKLEAGAWINTLVVSPKLTRALK